MTNLATRQLALLAHSHPTLFYIPLNIIVNKKLL